MNRLALIMFLYLRHVTNNLTALTCTSSLSKFFKWLSTTIDLKGLSHPHNETVQNISLNLSEHC